MYRLRPGVFLGSFDATKKARIEVEGYTHFSELVLHLEGTSTTQIDWDDVTLSVQHLNGRNFGSIVSLTSLKYYITRESAGFGHSSIVNPVVPGAVSATIRISLGLPGHKNPLGVKPGETLLFTVGAVPNFTGNWTPKVEENPGLTHFLPQIDDRTLTLTAGNDRFDLPDNLAGFLLTAATVTPPTEVNIFQGSTLMDSGSFAQLLRESCSKWNWDGGTDPTDLFYWFTGGLWEKKRIFEALQSGVFLKLDGGSGTMDLTLFTIEPMESLFDDSVKQAQELGKIARARIQSGSLATPRMRKILLPVMGAVDEQIANKRSSF